jgi:TRAP-type C4-dicarboxylate transport system substrate-binding protein
MCSLENAIETMDKSVLVSHEVFKILIDEYRKAHTEDAVTALLDNQDIGVATEGEIITLLKSARLETEQLKEHILALQGSANAF